METITSFLTEDHRYADELFAAAEKYGAQGAWNECEQKLAEFRRALETHMRIEEDVLFPAFEQATGMTSGPTAVMRVEHQEMLKTLDAMRSARERSDVQGFGSLARSFTQVLNTHSAKEETVLYPMCDRVVQTTDASELREKLQELRSAAS